MNTEIKHNYYEILEVAESATQHDILIAYEKAKRTYSTQNPSLYSIFSVEEAQELRSLIDEAYTVLSNQTYRTIYEKKIQTKNFEDADLTADSIKKASLDLFSDFKKITPPKVDTYVIDSVYENELANKTEWTGEDLKKVREYKKVTIEYMQEKTKINPWYLTAIEKFDVANLPAPVFVRGYIIQIARLLGLKDSVVADSYMKTFKKKIEN